MKTRTPGTKRETLTSFYKREWKAALLLAAAYLVFMWLSERYIPHPATLFPASGIALSALFLEGIELWPVVYIASFFGTLLTNVPTTFLIFVPIAQTLQAIIGAALMRKAAIDPLFRRWRDTFWLIIIVFLVSFIAPTFNTLANLISTGLFQTPYILATWSLRYAGTVLSLLILTPFLLRWFAKPRFSRTTSEISETVGVFLILLIIDIAVFVKGVLVVGGIPLVYLLLIPLFWIALRLRPRFVTLALLITSVCGVVGLYVGSPFAVLGDFNTRLFQMEEFLIVLDMIFLTIVSLEEDRRLSSNLLKSQIATLENAVSRISSESNAKNDFIAVLAHELRNPLAPIVTAIDVLKLREDRDREEKETLNMMDNRMHTVRRLLDDLLDISRISEGKVALRKEKADLEKILRQAVLSTIHGIRERHQSFTFVAPEHPLYVQGDPVRIEQIVSNLLTNASKYSDSGDQITLSLTKIGDCAEIVVSDTGVGIEPAVIEKIFTPFHQVELGARSKKGLGIGLALVKSFAEMHGGTVTASSKGVGKGSEFTVRLPLLQEELTTEPMDTKTKELEFGTPVIKPTPKPGPGPRILVVDDNDAAAWGMGKLLELKGCKVAYAYDGHQAIEQAVELTPDVILLDVGLPDMDGYEVAKTIRARGYHGKLIALTGFSTEDARAKGHAAGFEHYLVKPAGFADLKRVIPEIA